MEIFFHHIVSYRVSYWVSY